MTITLHEPQRAEIPGDLLARWRRVPVAVAVDMGGSGRQVSPDIRPLRPAGLQPALFGRAVTAKCSPPDFGAVLQALGLVGPGDVLCIDAGGHEGNAMIGDVLGGHLHSKGAAGIVCDGAIRDVANLARMEGLSVYTRHINPRGPTGWAEGVVNGSVMIGGARVDPGDLILGDDDGLAVLSPQALGELIDRAEAKLATEERWIARLAAGETVKAVFGLT